MANCPDCNGTGRDDKKTAAYAKEDAEFRHRVKHHGTYIRCWMCNGNGLDPVGNFRNSDEVFPTAEESDDPAEDLPF